jgi:hypothetical protein
LRVHFQWVNDRARHVVLQGPARIVFEGVWHV